MEDDVITWGVGGQQLAPTYVPVCNCHISCCIYTKDKHPNQEPVTQTKGEENMSLSLVLFLSST